MKYTMQRSHHNKATVQDVATLAGVSVATVSRSLSTPDKVSDATRSKVLEAVKSTGYTVNEAARNLRRQQTGNIVIFLPNIGNTVFSNVVESVAKVFAANNLDVYIVDTKMASTRSNNSKSYFSCNKVDGILMLDGMMPLDTLLSQEEVPPTVVAVEWQDGNDLLTVKIDDFAGAKLAAEHLHELGHRQFGHIAGDLHYKSGTIRRDGFLSALENTGIQRSAVWLVEGDYTLAAGKEAALAWLALPAEQRPTGIFCAGDEMAFGFISTLIKRGIKVPEEVSIVGFDDLDVAEYYAPPLTTIHQPSKRLGTLAAETLLALIKKETLTQAPELIAPWLVIRDSTCPPPNRSHDSLAP